MYTALFLDEHETTYLFYLLFRFTNFYIPFGHEILGDHCTLNMGENDRFKSLEGKLVNMRVTGYAKNDRVSAVRVEILDKRVTSLNNTSHITLSVNRKVGAKPVESNNIPKNQWVNISNKELIVVGKLLTHGLKVLS